MIHVYQDVFVAIKGLWLSGDCLVMRYVEGGSAVVELWLRN